MIFQNIQYIKAFDLCQNDRFLCHNSDPFEKDFLKKSFSYLRKYKTVNFWTFPLWLEIDFLRELNNSFYGFYHLHSNKSRNHFWMYWIDSKIEYDKIIYSNLEPCSLKFSNSGGTNQIGFLTHGDLENDFDSKILNQPPKLFQYSAKELFRKSEISSSIIFFIKNKKSDE